jgi:hypothetical protein
MACKEEEEEEEEEVNLGLSDKRRQSLDEG